MELKVYPEDFNVKEHLDVNVSNVGKYLLCRVFRKNMDHFSMIKKISSFLRIQEKLIGVAGIKDSRAIIEQYISLPSYLESRFSEKRMVIDENENSRLDLEILGRIDFSINIGQLESNDFEIIIRDISEKERNAFLEKSNRFENFVFPNYFGDQRFGNDYNNIRIGYFLVSKQFSEAERLVRGEKTGNSILSLSKLPRRMRILILSSFQSAIFNMVLIKRLSESKLNENKFDIESLVEFSKKRLYLNSYSTSDLEEFVPLAGLGMKSHEKTLDIMTKLNISERDFAIRQMPELLLEPAERKAFVKTKISSEWIDNSTIMLKFNLPRGSYATVLIENLFIY